MGYQASHDSRPENAPIDPKDHIRRFADEIGGEQLGLVTMERPALDSQLADYAVNRERPAAQSRIRMGAGHQASRSEIAGLARRSPRLRGASHGPRFPPEGLGLYGRAEGATFFLASGIVTRQGRDANGGSGAKP